MIIYETITLSFPSESRCNFRPRFASRHFAELPIN